MQSNKNNDAEAPGIIPAEYWDARYVNNETGWDMHQVSPPLKSYIDTLEENDLKILIPGCGNAYEAQYLLEKGFTNVTLIDISKVITARLKEKYKGLPLTIVTGNFFDHEGAYDLVLEQTFFCTFPPTLRKKYAEKCYRLLNNNGKIAGVLFNKKLFGTEPPYIGTDEEYKEVFTSLFVFSRYEECKNSIMPRLGSEVFFEFEKKTIEPKP